MTMMFTTLWPSARLFWSELRLGWKLSLVLAIPMTALCLVAALAIVALERQEQNEQFAQRTLDVQEALHQAEIGAVDLSVTVRLYLLTSDPALASSFDESRRGLSRRLASLDRLSLDSPAQRLRLEEVHTAADDWFANLAEVMTARPAASSAAATRLTTSMVTLLNHLRELRSSEQQATSVRRTAINQHRRRANVQIGSVAMVGAAGAAFSVWLFTSDVTQRVKRAAASTQKLVPHGAPENVAHGDEMAQLERGLEEAAILLETRAEAYQLARNGLDRVFELSVDMLCISCADGTFEQVNPAWEQTLGWASADLRASHYVELVHPDDREATAAVLAAPRAVGEIVSFSNRFRCKDGSYQTLSWRTMTHPESGRIYSTARRLASPEGPAPEAVAPVPPTGMRPPLTVLRGDGRRVLSRLSRAPWTRVSRSSRHSAPDPERASQAKTAFLAQMSHDLRTPLNAILGFAQLLERSALTDEQSDYVQQIRRGGEHLLEMIGEVIDIAKIESGRLTIAPQPLAVNRLVARAVQLVTPLAEQRGITLRVDPVSSDLGVLADSQRVHQILLNLLSNAIKYNRPHGSVSIGAHLASPGRCRIAVTDTGAGLSAPKLARLFVPFDRLGAEQTETEGTGLGLAVARAMAEAMGGTIGVRSVVDQGTTFWLELGTAAVVEPHAPSTAIDAAPEHRPARSGVVLCIDDNHTNIRLMKRILEQRPQVTFLSATDGRTGLELARQQLPDLVFVDLHLPDLSGEEIVKELSKTATTTHVRCVVLTADANPALADRLQSAGTNQFLTKPVNISVVLSVVDDILGTRNAAQASAESA